MNSGKQKKAAFAKAAFSMPYGWLADGSTSHPTPHTSHLTPLSYLTPRTSHLIPHTSYLSSQTS